jgi:hypothetical protein
MLQARTVSNMFQKRLIRPKYAHTQATPYACYLDPALRNADGSFNLPAGAFKLQNGLVPGTVMVRVGATEAVRPATGAANEVPFGLLANFVGGTLDDLRDENTVGVWRGPDATFELLAPAFDSTGLAAAITTAASAPYVPVKLYAQATGLLGTTVGAATTVVANLVLQASVGKIEVDLKV